MLHLSRWDKMIAIMITFQHCKIFPKPQVSLKLDFLDLFKCACSNTPTPTEPSHFLLMQYYFWSKHLLIKEQYDSFIDICVRSLRQYLCGLDKNLQGWDQSAEMISAHRWPRVLSAPFCPLLLPWRTPDRFGSYSSLFYFYYIRFISKINHHYRLHRCIQCVCVPVYMCTCGVYCFKVPLEYEWNLLPFV